MNVVNSHYVTDRYPQTALNSFLFQNPGPCRLHLHLQAQLSLWRYLNLDRLVTPTHTAHTLGFPLSLKCWSCSLRPTTGVCYLKLDHLVTSPHPPSGEVWASAVYQCKEFHLPCGPCPVLNQGFPCPFTSAIRQKTFYLSGAFKCFLAGQKACKTAQGIKYRKYGIKWQAHAHFSHFQTLSLVLLKLT